MNLIQIKKLESDIGILSYQLGRAEAQVRELKAYCMSDKFVGHENNFVNPSYIVARIDNDILPEFNVI